MPQDKNSDKITVGDIENSQGVAIGTGATAIVGYTADQVSALVAKIGATFQPKPFDGRSPYVGLAAFQEADADRFFGREKLVDELVERVKSTRAIFIAGPSGSGKSSLARAGLMHALRMGVQPNAPTNSSTWLYETMQPGRAPLDELGRVVSRWANSVKAGDEFRASANDPTMLHRWAEIAAGDARDRRAILLVDQFEEIFTQVSAEHEAERVAFLNLLTHAATVKNGRVTILFALRSDFVSHCATYPQLNALLNQQFLQVGAMTPDELVSAIAQPALRVGLRIDPYLIAQIVNEMRDAPNALPLMQFALDDLFNAQPKGGVIALTLPDYLARGGLQKALERHADAAFAHLDAGEQKIARAIFAGVIEIGRGMVDTRRTAVFDELVPAGADIAHAQAVVQKLADARLIATDEREGKETVTLAHERLIDAWQWLLRLVNENREQIALQNKIAEDARTWDANARDASYLYTGARLATAREQLDAKKISPSGLAQQFLQAGIRANEAERRARLRRTRALIGGLGTAVVIFALLAGLALVLWQQGIVQQSISRSRELAAVAMSQLNVDPERAILIAIEANQPTHTYESEDALRQAILNSHLRITLPGHKNGVSDAQFSADGKMILTVGRDNIARVWDSVTGKRLAVLQGETAQFSPDGKKIVTASEDNITRVWDIATGKELVVIQGHSPHFSPDGKKIVTLPGDKTAHVWDAATGKELFILRGLEANINFTLYSGDGKMIVTQSDDGMVHIWDAESGREVSVLRERTGLVMGISPDGKQIVTSSGGTALIWDVARGGELIQLRGHTDYLTSMSFSPDGKQIVTGGEDNTARVWEVASGRELKQLPGHTGSDRIFSVTFSPDGTQIAMGSGDKFSITADSTAIIWDAESGREVLVLRGHTGWVGKVAFSPNGKQIVSASGNDETARIWDIASGREVTVLRGHRDTIRSIAFSPDSKQIATGSDDGTARIWDVASGRALMEVGGDFVAFSPDGKRILTGRGHLWDVASGRKVLELQGLDQTSGVAFSPDGKYIAISFNSLCSGNNNNTGGIWDAVSGRHVTQLGGFEWFATSISFSPDGKQVVTGSCDGAAHLWDAATGREVMQLRGHTDQVTSVDFNPNGKQIVTGSDDGTARIWDVASGRELRQVPGHTDTEDRISSVAFSPDGKQIATGHLDRTARLWDAASGRELTQLHGHAGWVFSVAFSPDGKLIATGSQDNSVIVYYTHIEDLIELARTRVFRDLMCDERVQYLHESIVCPTPTPQPTATVTSSNTATPLPQPTVISSPQRATTPTLQRTATPTRRP